MTYQVVEGCSEGKLKYEVYDAYGKVFAVDFAGEIEVGVFNTCCQSMEDVLRNLEIKARKNAKKEQMRIYNAKQKHIDKKRKSARKFKNENKYEKVERQEAKSKSTGYDVVTDEKDVLDLVDQAILFEDFMNR